MLKVRCAGRCRVDVEGYLTLFVLFYLFIYFIGVHLCGIVSILYVLQKLEKKNYLRLVQQHQTISHFKRKEMSLRYRYKDNHEFFLEFINL